MADVSNTLVAWSSTSNSNNPSGATTIGTGVDDNFREIQGVVVRSLSHKGSDIASATTTDLAAASTEGLFHDITGTTTITGLGTVAAGVWKVIKFEGALTLTHNATSLILPGGANITTANGDIGIFVSEGSGNWRCVAYQKASGLPVVASGGTLGTPTNFSGSSTTLTGIPSSAKLVIVPFTGMSTNGTTSIVGKVGPSGGVVSTGYGGSQYNWTGSASSMTTSFLLRQTGASSVGNGVLVLVLLNSSTNTWLAFWEIGGSDTAQGYTGAATISLSGALERVEFSCGADSFDAGSFNTLVFT